MPDPAGPYRHRGTPAVERMVEYAPSSGGLALWVRHRDRDAETPRGVATPGAAAADARASPVIETDGTTIFYGLAFASLPLAEQTGLVAHQVLHVALRHAQRYLDLHERIGDVDLALFNTCADAIVNSTLDHLAWLRLPPGAVRLDRLLAEVLAQGQDLERSLLEWDVERLYRTIDDRRPPERHAANPRERRDGPRATRVRALGAGTAIDLAPDAGAQGAPEAQAGQAREWAERLLRAHAGDGPHSLLRTLLADLPRSRMPWERVLRTQLARSLAPQRELSWSRPSRSYLANQGRSGPGRRMPWEPGFAGTRTAPRLVVVVDVSGSVDDALMARFAREIEAIVRRLEAGLVLVVGDERVLRVERFEPGRASTRGSVGQSGPSGGAGGAGGAGERWHIVFAGGGGTDFTPLLEEADTHDPDIVLVLTDLQGPARFRPRCPVVWAVPEAHAAAVAPFGRKVVLA